MMPTISKAEARRMMERTPVWDVTNHYIEREDHPCFGTVRRELTEVNSASFGWMLDEYHERLPFSRFTFAETVDGSLWVYGRPDDPNGLLLTMTPAS